MVESSNAIQTISIFFGESYLFLFFWGRSTLTCQFYREIFLWVKSFWQLLIKYNLQNVFKDIFLRKNINISTIWKNNQKFLNNKSTDPLAHARNNVKCQRPWKNVNVDNHSNVSIDERLRRQWLCLYSNRRFLF